MACIPSVLTNADRNPLIRKLHELHELHAPDGRFKKDKIEDDALAILETISSKNLKDTSKGNALVLAVGFGLGRLVGKLIEKGIDVNELSLQGKTALHYACEAGKDVIASLLLDAGADVNTKENINPHYTPATQRGYNGMTALEILEAKGTMTDIQELIKAKFPSSAGGRRRNLTKRRKQKRQQRNRRRTSNRYN